MASLRFRAGRYFVDYRVNGQRFRKATGKSKKVAELTLKDIEVKIERNDNGFIEKDVELSKLFQEFLAYGITHHSPRTQNRYRAILDNFKEFLKQFPFIKKASQFDSKLFEDYQTFRKLKGAANKTVNIELICLKAMLNLAVKWNYLWINPAKNVASLKEEQNKAPRFLSKEECKTLLENCDDFFYPIIYTFLHTGMRKSELEFLTWGDVDFERKKIKIRYKDDWSPKTSEREIPISNCLFDLLKKQRETHQVRSCPYVFHFKGDRIEANYLRKKYLPLTEKCGFPDVTKIHTLRHTFASHLVMSGVDLPTVKKLMGHADIETTMIYSHLADEHVDKADLSWRLKDFMLECCGCGDITLKRTSLFLENNEEEEATYYPPRVSRRRPQWFDKLPKEYEDLLKEIYSSLHADNRFLSAMGARSIIDIFIYRKVGDCGNFNLGLKKLVDLGYITPRNKIVIESAIEVGHAATHRSFKPTENQLNMVMDIVENLIQQDLIEDSATTLKKALPARGVRLQKDIVK